MNNPTPNQPSIVAACCAVLFVGALLLAGTGCSEYNKIMKSTDLDYKYERALGFLDSNKCYGALPLLEEVVSLTRGTERSVNAQYNFAKAHRCVIAFENALKEYPDTPYREQMQWLIVDSYFQYAELSTERRKLERYNDTIEAFLTFVARYPESQHMAQAQNVHDRSVKAIDNLAANRPIE